MSRDYDIRDTDLPGFLLRVSVSGWKAFYCVFRRPNGAKTRKKLGCPSHMTVAQARDMARIVLGDVARGIDPTAKEALKKAVSLGKFIRTDYRESVTATQRRGEEAVKRLLSCFSEFENKKLSEISPWIIEKWKAARMSAGAKPATINRNIGALKAALSLAVKWEFIKENPLASLRPMKTDSLSKARFLTKDEMIRLRSALRQRDQRIKLGRSSHNAWLGLRRMPCLKVLNECPYADHLEPMVLLSINTGLRRGELFNLTWEDVSLEREKGSLTVRGAYSKNGKTRHVFLNSEARSVLSKWKASSGEPSGLVFRNDGGGRFNNVKKSWSSVLEEAGIVKFRWHDLRHHFASSLAANEVALNTIRELLGHSDIKMTMRYAHLSPDVKAKAVETLVELDESEEGVQDMVPERVTHQGSRLVSELVRL